MAATLIHSPNADPLALILKGLSSDDRCLLSFVLEPEGPVARQRFTFSADFTHEL